MPPQTHGSPCESVCEQKTDCLAEWQDAKLRIECPLDSVRVRDPQSPPGQAVYRTNALIINDPHARLRYLVDAEEIVYTYGKELLWRATSQGLGNSKRRKSFLCILYQEGRCKGFQRCNNIHLCPARVVELRSLHQTRPIPRLENRASEPLTIRVTDPEDPSHELQLRPGTLSDTKGKMAGMSGQKVSMCSAKLARSCAARSGCSGLHLRQDVSNQFWIDCCMAHAPTRDEHADIRRQLLQTNVALRLHGTQIVIPGELFAVTGGLRAVLQENRGCSVIPLPLGKFCHRHVNRECKHGTNCSNLHVCRKNSLNYFSPPAAPLRPP
eukprot:Hpha_TRINITY_DN20153_c0_g1::TRINITY_DN20153_c0_g1_i1::g.82460::m.82460